VGSYSTIAQLLPGRQESSSETTSACRYGTRWSANSEAAVILVVDVVVIAVHGEPVTILASVALTNVTHVLAYRQLTSNNY